MAAGCVCSTRGGKHRMIFCQEQLFRDGMKSESCTIMEKERAEAGEHGFEIMKSIPLHVLLSQ
jgi:hypothetical protein